MGVVKRSAWLPSSIAAAGSFSSFHSCWCNWVAEWWGAGVVICLERGADLHMAQLMPLPLTVSCFSKIQIAFTFLVPAHPVVPDKGPLAVCVCVCVCVLQLLMSVWLVCWQRAEAVRKSKLTQAACDADVERVVRDWLRTASDRNGGRRQRDSRVTETPRRVRPSHAAAATVQSTLPVPRAPDADVN